MKLLTIFCLLCVFWAAPASADAVLKYSLSSSDEAAETQELQVLVKDGRVLLRGGAGADDRYLILFDRARRDISVAWSGLQGHYRISETEARQKKVEMQQFIEWVEEKTAGYRREDIADAFELSDMLMAEEYGGSAPVQLDYRGNGPRDNANMGSCEHFSVHVNETHDRDICVAGIRSVGLANADIETLEAFARTSNAILESAPLYLRWVPRYGVDLARGVPVTVDYLSEESPQTRLDIQSVDTASIATDELRLPESFAKPMSITARYR